MQFLLLLQPIYLLDVASELNSQHLRQVLLVLLNLLLEPCDALSELIAHTLSWVVLRARKLDGFKLPCQSTYDLCQLFDRSLTCFQLGVILKYRRLEGVFNDCYAVMELFDDSLQLLHGSLQLGSLLRKELLFC